MLFLYALVFMASPIQKTIPVGVTSESISGGLIDGTGIVEGTH
jgi:hypothetical protein